MTRKNKPEPVPYSPKLKLVDPRRQVLINERTIDLMVDHITKHKIKVGCRNCSGYYDIIFQVPDDDKERGSVWLTEDENGHDFLINWHAEYNWTLSAFSLSNGFPTFVFGTMQGGAMHFPNKARPTMRRLIREIKRLAKERPACWKELDYLRLDAEK